MVTIVVAAMLIASADVYVPGIPAWSEIMDAIQLWALAIALAVGFSYLAEKEGKRPLWKKSIWTVALLAGVCASIFLYTRAYSIESQCQSRSGTLSYLDGGIHVSDQAQPLSNRIQYRYQPRMRQSNPIRLYKRACVSADGSLIYWAN